MAFTPDGDYLLVVNQDSNNLAVFTVNANGQLASLTSRTVCDSPVFVRAVLR
jgi:6-phosphogluconolactonase (cycloisomerase 2 family)